MFNLRSINKVRSQTPYASPVIYIKNDMAIHEFDRAMVYVSIWLSQDIMVERPIGNIRVSMTKRDRQQLRTKCITR